MVGVKSQTNNIKSFTQSILGWKLIGHIVRKQSCGGKTGSTSLHQPCRSHTLCDGLFPHSLRLPQPVPLHSPSSKPFYLPLRLSLRESKSMHSAFLLHNLHIGLVFQSQVTSQMELSPKPLRAPVWWSAEAPRLIQSAVGGIALLSTFVLFYSWFRWDEEEQNDMTLLRTLTCFNINRLKSRGEKQGARRGKDEHHPSIALV